MANVIISDAHLTDIADAIRSKNGTEDTYKPREMAAAITAIEVGSGGDGECSGMHIPEEALTISGHGTYRFYKDCLTWFVNVCGDRITTSNIGDTAYMFSEIKGLDEIPFDINISKTCKNMSKMFNNSNLKSVPMIYGELAPQTSDYAGNLNIDSFFLGCKYLRHIPNDYFWNFGGEDFWESSMMYGGSSSRVSIFQQCNSLRKLPDISMLKNKTAYYSCLYQNAFTDCYALDEITDLPVLDISLNSAVFSNFVKNCCRLKNLTFETNDDGTPYVVGWKGQTIDLSKIGIGIGDTYITNYNSGITEDKKVYDDATYAALKDDADWYSGWKDFDDSPTAPIKYSRYNHDSAVNTINSLPDTSEYLATAGGTNTIKFTGAAGSGTDGGAINTLTEEEIAVAAAKGWTVAFA